MSRLKGSKNKPKLTDLLGKVTKKEVAMMGLVATVELRMEKRINRLTVMLALVSLSTAFALMSIFLHFSRIVEVLM